MLQNVTAGNGTFVMGKLYEFTLVKIGVLSQRCQVQVAIINASIVQIEIDAPHTNTPTHLKIQRDLRVNGRNKYRSKRENFSDSICYRFDSFDRADFPS